MSNGHGLFAWSVLSAIVVLPWLIPLPLFHKLDFTTGGSDTWLFYVLTMLLLAMLFGVTVMSILFCVKWLLHWIGD